MPNTPPKAWWDQMVKEVSEGNPDYSKEQVDKTVGDIWYHKMTPSKKKEVTKKTESINVAADGKDWLIQDIKQFAESLSKLLASSKLEETAVDRANFYISKIQEKANQLQQAMTQKISSIQVTALDRSLFVNLHEDFKKSLQDRVQAEMKGELAKNPTADPTTVYQNIFNETYKYLTNLYSDALKSDIGQMQNTVMQELKTNVAQESIPDTPKQPGIQPGASKSYLQQAVEKNAKIKELCDVYSRSIDDFRKLAVTIDVGEVQNLIKTLTELQQKKEQLEKEPITQKSIDQMQELVNEQQGREPQ